MGGTTEHMSDDLEINLLNKTKCKCHPAGDLVSFLIKTKYLTDDTCEICGGYINA